jgi:hypothetical protein
MLDDVACAQERLLGGPRRDRQSSADFSRTLREGLRAALVVLPEPGYLEGVRELTRRYSVLLINDETHTFSAGPGGATRA